MTVKPKLRLFDLTMIVVGLVIGMGIFRTSSDAANAAVTPSVFFIAWFAGGLVALCGALTYAEIGSRYPVTGGYYKIFSYAYHPSIAFALNCSTQMIYDMGLSHLLQGITFECPYQALKEKTKVVRCVLEGRQYSSSEIDTIFSCRLNTILHH